ncbi:hypothetical protein A3752_04980 [Oleiphilus sp. HI0081]|uniref:MASE3 domain-containing protein n=2 Tax=Oleiphilus TaxID=141450 RepID=UPI0007C2E1B2|nr:MULTISPECIES: MASE3 domain-containing protein [unclassified Oleiphilus]KZY85538.1 hypothetical protein A3743_03215 [Oleiphilus sp. HI0072]KZZ12129.1 hypothetical protein A3749_07105 [Oleiphilus sp. HI0078]KZZ25387.1 hypothetical protein A3752_04980 [Oleiphilus sp. HI0081]KZY39879.1 hypothetical protein A3729_02050 [Oleiphilus sp. HI0043]KZZ66394.1 hypothetical protein A3763_03065 [Oleiphilus sp. HI0128]
MTSPKKLTIGLFFLCTLPFLPNMLGIDFGAAPTKVDIVTTQSSMLEALQGAILHTILEWSAISIACIGAIFAFVHYYYHRNITLPIMGLALLSAASIDIFHTLASARVIDAQAQNTDFIPFTWALSRLFNASIMTVGAALSLWALHHSNNPPCTSI